MIRDVDLDALRADPENPKFHAVESIKASLRRFGLGAAFVIDDRTGLLVSGHGRREALLAMRTAGEEPPEGAEGWRVPVVFWRSRDPGEARAFLLAANRLTEEGGWDAPRLEAILDRLGEARLEGIGFDRHDLQTVRAAAADARLPVPAARPPRILTCPACTKTFPDAT